MRSTSRWLARFTDGRARCDGGQRHPELVAAIQAVAADDGDIARHRRLHSWSACRTPRATPSLYAKMASGGSGKRSRRCVAARLPSNVSSILTTSDLSNGSPSSLSPWRYPHSLS